MSGGVGGCALSYASRGWAVFPTMERGKRPHPVLAPHGLHDATTDLETIERWWDRCPQAGVAIRAGAISGLVVVDVDGDKGAENFRRLQRQRGRIDETLWCRTPSGGWHAYFAHPGGELRNTAARLAPGIDTRGDGGYVVAPPSVHPNGERYSWWDEAVEPLPLPRWLLHLLRPPKPQAGERRRPIEEHRDLGPYVAAALEREVAAVASAQPGQRNDQLNRSAFALGTLAGAGAIAEEVIRSTLLEAAATCGLTRGEATRTIASGLNAGKAQPREVAS